MDRLSQLKQFAEEEPGDPFNHYALALEYLKTDPSEAGRIFERLARQQPQYLPTYYPYAQWLIERKNTERAEEIFNQGIAEARQQQDQKTLKELQAAYSDWQYER